MSQSAYHEPCGRLLKAPRITDSQRRAHQTDTVCFQCLGSPLHRVSHAARLSLGADDSSSKQETGAETEISLSGEAGEAVAHGCSEQRVGVSKLTNPIFANVM